MKTLMMIMLAVQVVMVEQTYGNGIEEALKKVSHYSAESKKEKISVLKAEPWENLKAIRSTLLHALEQTQYDKPARWKEAWDWHKASVLASTEKTFDEIDGGKE